MFSTKVVTIAFVALIFCELASSAGTNCKTCRKRSVESARIANPDSLPFCSPSDSFAVQLIISNSHLYLKFSPASPSNPACQAYVFDSKQWNEAATGKEYSVGILQSLSAAVDDEPSSRQDLIGRGYLLGNVTGSRLIEAVHAFEAKMQGRYDVITNNCASRLIDVLVFLGIESSLDEAALEWISQRLIGGRVIGMMRGSDNLAHLFPGLTRQQIMAKTDEELISHLVHWYSRREISLYGTTLQQYRSGTA